MSSSVFDPNALIHFSDIHNGAGCWYNSQFQSSFLSICSLAAAVGGGQVFPQTRITKPRGEPVGFSIFTRSFSRHQLKSPNH